MSRPDIRPQLMRNALANGDLGNTERVFLMTVVALAAEYVDGSRRPGSKGMDERGHFALHYDYLARALHTSKGNAEKIAYRLAAKGYLSKVHTDTFGRPATFQALDVRADKKYGITLRAFVRPYDPDPPPVRADMVSDLPYKTHVGPDHQPTSGDSPQPSAGKRRQEEAAVPRLPSRRTTCETHQWADCLDHRCAADGEQAS